ncbi:hypothetical protein B0T24DRAFT_623163 [Lasiosphaeria ovina]|uniref:F-box domain-containing protein n=1 Tax=Lasiosphaeria ovina TaxID=92902 RepID=A0AAE0KCI5_9PEZI|nr:hypothetical protein B0T24DRAFT_623163 [Lasiosphaeria ovina]
MESRLSAVGAQMAKGEYSAALTPLLQAISACQCAPTTHGKDKSCNMLQCIEAANNPDRPDALVIVAKSPCSCGFSWPSCADPLHIKAVDLLAECLERAGHYAAAFSTGLGLIRLDPASPAGYCRVIKILRHLLTNYRGSNPNVARSLAVVLRDGKLSSVNQLRELIRSFVKAGIYNMNKYRHSPDDKYHLVIRAMAHKLDMPEARQDPVRKLPREILGMVLSYLDSTAVLRCVRVSKQWNEVFVSDKTLWREFRLGKPRSPGRFLGNFLNKHGHIRTLVINDAGKFALTSLKMSMLCRGLPDLERLSLGCVVPLAESIKLDCVAGKHLTKLTHLTLKGGALVVAVFGPLAQLASRTLEALHLFEFETHIDGIFASNPMPRLKRLRLSHQVNLTKSYLNEAALRLEWVTKATPNLEAFFIDHSLLSGCQSTSSFDGAQGWPCLRSLVIGSGTILIHQQRIQLRCLPPFAKNLRSLEILSTNVPLTQNMLFTAHSANGLIYKRLGLSEESFPSELLGLPELQVFRCRVAITPELLEHVIGPAAKSGTLEVLELTASSSGNGLAIVFGGGFPSANIEKPAAELAFTYSDKIRWLGLSNFNWSVHYSGFDGQPFLDWLAGFPNVDTVAVYPGNYGNTAPFILKLISAGGALKTVYQECCRGTDFDEAQKLAAERGVTLHHVAGYVPPEWPTI